MPTRNAHPRWRPCKRSNRSRRSWSRGRSRPTRRAHRPQSFERPAQRSLPPSSRFEEALVFDGKKRPLHSPLGCQVGERAHQAGAQPPEEPRQELEHRCPAAPQAQAGHEENHPTVLPEGWALLKRILRKNPRLPSPLECGQTPVYHLPAHHLQGVQSQLPAQMNRATHRRGEERQGRYCSSANTRRYCNIYSLLKTCLNRARNGDGPQVVYKWWKGFQPMLRTNTRSRPYEAPLHRLPTTRIQHVR